MSKGVLFDGTRCIGCRACSVACKSWNRNRKTPKGGVDRGRHRRQGHPFRQDLHLHALPGNRRRRRPEMGLCQDTVHALPSPGLRSGLHLRGNEKRRRDGRSSYHREKCIGCRYCMVACPFGIPTYEWDKWSPWIKKCTFCADRQHGNDSEPAGTCTRPASPPARRAPWRSSRNRGRLRTGLGH